MGNCLGPEKSAGGTYDSNGDKVTASANPRQRPPRQKGKTGIDNSVFDDTLYPQQQQSNAHSGEAPSVPILLPDNPNFTCSVNGRNGWLVHEVYDFGESVRSLSGYQSLAKCR